MDLKPRFEPSPCKQFDCCICCHETEMTLTETEIKRLKALGHKDFYHEVDGYVQLKNKDGHCVFLDGSRCTIYNDRPEGCVLYPLVQDLDTDLVWLHDFCPHAFEFDQFFTEAHEHRLREIIQTEEREKEARTSKKM